MSITVVPDSIAARWILVRPDGTEMAGEGTAIVPDAEEGPYWLLWEPRPGWDPPVDNPERYLHEKGIGEGIEGRYRRFADATGTLRIEAGEPGIGITWNLTGPDEFFAAGRGSRTLGGRRVGEYTLTWVQDSSDESGGQSTQRLEAEGSLVLRAAADDGTAAIVIDHEPKWLSAPWTLESLSGTRIDGRGHVLVKDLEPGIWTMNWGEVEGFVAPASSQVQLVAGVTIYWPGEYVREPGAVGVFVIDAEPDALNAPWILESGDGIRLTGLGDTVLEYVPPGVWTLRWQPVDGYLTPPALQTVLHVGRTIVWPGKYVPSTTALGLILIDPEPDAIDAPWVMVSQYGEVYSGSGDSMLVDVPVGQYTLTWGQVRGWETPTPNPVVQVLEPGATARFTPN